jgi:benzoyl-CoA reductase subunit BamC
LTYEEREVPVEVAEEEEQGEMEIAYEMLIKKHGKKKVMDTFARLSRA